MHNSVDLQKILHMARMNVSEGEIANIRESVKNIVSWVARIEIVDTENIEPMYNSLDSIIDFNSRNDVVTTDQSVDNVISNVPNHENGFIVVPKVIE